MIDCETEVGGQYPQALRVRKHTFRADLEAPDSTDAAPSPHDLFDASLAACKALTATWYAKKNGIPLERVETCVERDDSEERKGKYVLTVRMQFFGPLDDAQRQKLADVVARCPVHKLMTTVEIEIRAVPWERDTFIDPK